MAALPLMAIVVITGGPDSRNPIGPKEDHDVRPEDTEIAETNTPARGACLTSGCPCKDARIVSHRRAAFYATVARSSGETADRVVPPEPGWRLPAPVAAGLDLLLALPDAPAAPAQIAEELRPSAATVTERNDR